MSVPLAIVAFFVGHWVISVFFQTFFQHRYCAHRMFTMSRGWERFFHLCAFLTQGSSYLNPRAYAILHRMHHAYSDTEKDPHSPVVHKEPFRMMTRTWGIYVGLRDRKIQPEERFEGGYPEWKLLDRIAGRYSTAAVFATAYTMFYFVFATQWWHFLLLPIHFMMGPTHGAIVNWFGHWMGYRNFDERDNSKNVLIFDFVTLGELFQNNHHRHGSRPNFAVRWFEVDPTWYAIWFLDKVGIITLADKKSLSRAPTSVAVEPA